MKPTEQQQAVIDCHDGKIIVQACAGSGKTSTMAKRTMAINPSHSKLVLAFNKKAAEEFSSKLKDCDNTSVLTFHSFCYREVLKNYRSYGFREEVTLWQKFPFDLVKLACNIKARSWEESGIDKDIYEFCGYSYYTHELKELIENSKPRYTNEEYEELSRTVVHFNDTSDPRLEQYQEKFRKERIRRIEYRTYRAVLCVREFMLNRGIVDFSSMVRIVAENRHNLINKFDHIMVDEFQDVDRFQFDIIRTLGKSPDVISIAVVGDINQLIYKWRGALDDSFQEFKDAFAGYKKFDLTMNFRSSGEIVSFAEEICEAEMNSFRGIINVPIIQKASVDLIADFIKENKNYKDFCILHRFNKDVEQTKKQLSDLDIPTFVIGGASDFWKSQHVNLALQYLQKNKSYSQLISSEDFMRICQKKKYREDESAMKEMTGDCEFVMGLNLWDIEKIKSCHQNKDGIQLSTIHKTKGLEWENVLIRNVDENLKNERCLYYVACTRPRSLLVLDIL